MSIPTLIDAPDTFEVVRDKIAAILALETTSQQALALAASKNPDLWKFLVYTERSNPWELLTSDTDLLSGEIRYPIINVAYDLGNFDYSVSNTSSQQVEIANYNIDIYGSAVQADVVAGGHIPADLAAVQLVHRTARLARAILMSSLYTYLELRGTVWYRRVQSKISFLPIDAEATVQNVKALRIILEVKFTELAPQAATEELQSIFTTISRSEDGAILAVLDSDVT